MTSATTCTAARRPGSRPSVANRIAQPTGTSYSDSGLAAGTYYYKVTAEDAAGNIGPPSPEANATATSDTSRSDRSGDADRDGRAGSGRAQLERLD